MSNLPIAHLVQGARLAKSLAPKGCQSWASCGAWATWSKRTASKRATHRSDLAFLRRGRTMLLALDTHTCVCACVCLLYVCVSVCFNFCVCVFIGLCSHVYSSLDVCVGVCVTASGSGAHFSLTLHSAIQLHLSLSVIWVFPHTDGKRSRSTHVSTTAGAGGTLTCIFLLGCPVCSIFVCNQVCMYLCTYVCTGMYVCMIMSVCIYTWIFVFIYAV